MKKRTKQFFAVLLSVVLMFSGLYVTDSKAETGEEVKAKISLSEAQVKPGDIITVAVGVENVSAVSPSALQSCKFNVFFDTDKFEFVRADGDNSETAYKSFTGYLQRNETTQITGTYSPGNALYQFTDADAPIASDTTIFSFKVKAKEVVKDVEDTFRVNASYQTITEGEVGDIKPMQGTTISADILVEKPVISLNNAPNTGKGYGNDVTVSVNKGKATIVNTATKQQYEATPDAPYTVTEIGTYEVNAVDAVGNESSTIFSKIGVASISVSKKPTKTSYVEGYTGAIDPEGGELTVHFTDGSTSEIPLSDAVLTYNKEDMKVGTQNVTVTYGKQTTTFTITVIEKSVTAISVKKEPTKTEYPEKTNVLLEGGKLTVSYDNGTTEDIDMAEATVSGYDSQKLGEQTITLTYEGKETTLKVTVVEKKVIGLSVAAPDGLRVTEGLKPDLSEVKATVTYDNGESEVIPVSDSMLTYQDTVGEQTVTVNYGGLKDHFKLQVIAKVATGIQMKSMPNKTEYKEGESFSLEGATLVVVYNNKTESTPIAITKTMLESEPIMTDYGKEQTAVVKYTVNNQIFKTDFSYVVNEKELSEISVKAPDKTTYIEKNEFLVQGGKITLKFDNGTTQVVELSADDCTGFDMSKVGEQTVTVSYTVKGITKTAQFPITVKAKTVSSIAVKKQPNVTTVLEGKDLSLAGGILSATYDNGDVEDIDMMQASVKGFDANKVGSQTVTLLYENQTTTIEISVKAKTLSTITITKNPKTMEYFSDEKYSGDGLVVEAAYDNGTTAIVTNQLKVTVPDFKLKDGQHSDKKTVTVSYTQGSVEKTASFIITVVSREKVADLNNTVQTVKKTDIEKLNPEKKAELADKILAGLDSYDKLGTELEKQAAATDFAELNKLLYTPEYLDKDSETGITFSAGAGVIRIDAKITAKKAEPFTFDAQNDKEKYDVLDSFLFSSQRVTDGSEIKLGSGTEGLKITVPMSSKVKEVYSSLLPNEKLLVVHQLEDGKGFEYLTPVIENGTLSITVNSLSPFEIVKVTIPEEVKSPDADSETPVSDDSGNEKSVTVTSDSAETDDKGVKTGDSTNTSGIVFIMVCAVGTLAVVNRSRKRRVKKIS